MEVALADAVVVEECQEKALPVGWAWTTLGQITDTTRKRVKPQDYPDLRFIGMEHVEAHTMRLLGSVPAREMRSAAEYFEPGDVLYGRLRPYLNKVYCPDFEGLCSAEFIVFRHVPHLDSRYLQYFLNSWDFVSFASHLNEGDRPRVNFSQLADYPFPLAPLAEQRRIVAEIEAQFTRLDAGVAALQRVQRALQRYRAGVLKAACEGRLVPQDPGDEPAGVLLQRILAARRARWEANELAKMKARGKTPKDDAWKRRYTEPAPPDTAGLPALPEGWCWAKLEQLITRIEAGHSPKAQGRPALPGEYGVVKVSAMSWGSFLPEENKALFPGHVPDDPLTIRAGDLLISRANTVELVGAVVLVERDHPNLMLSDKSLRIIPASDEVSPKWLLYVLRAPTVRHFFESVATGTSDSMRNLSQEKIRAAPIALPPLSEQHRIIAEVERRLSVVAEVEATVEANLKRAERLRQSILKRAFEGRLVPQDPNDEPAGELLARVRAQRRIRAAQLRFSGL